MMGGERPETHRVPKIILVPHHTETQHLPEPETGMCVQRLRKHPPQPGLISIKWKAERTGTSKGERQRKKNEAEEQGRNEKKRKELHEPGSVRALDVQLGGVHGRPAKAIDFICGQRGLFFLFHTNFHGQRQIKMAATWGMERGGGGSGGTGR